MEQCFQGWVPALFVSRANTRKRAHLVLYTGLSTISRHPTDQQWLTRQDMYQCINKGKEQHRIKHGCKQCRFRIVPIHSAANVMRKEMLSACFLLLTDAHIVFWLGINEFRNNSVYKKNPTASP